MPGRSGPLVWFVRVIRAPDMQNRKNGRGHLRGHRFARACAVEMHMDKVQRPFDGNLQEKRPGTPPGTSFCASLRSRNAHGHVTRGIARGNLQEDAGRFGYNYNLWIEHRALTPTVRTPQCGYTVWGIKLYLFFKLAWFSTQPSWGSTCDPTRIRVKPH